MGLPLPVVDEEDDILERGDVGDGCLDWCLSRGYERTAEIFATRYRGELTGDRELCCFCARGDIVCETGGSPSI